MSVDGSVLTPVVEVPAEPRAGAGLALKAWA